MKLIENMVLQTKLMLLTGMMVAAMIALGWMGFQATVSWKADIEEIGDVRVPSLIGVGRMRNGIQNVVIQQNRVRGLKGDAGIKAKMANAISIMDKEFERIENGIKLYAPLPQTPQEAVEYKKFEKHYADWLQASQLFKHDVLIRLTHLFAKVRELYFKLLMLEHKSEEMGEARQFLQESLEEMGYASYEDFMYDALQKELQMRTQESALINRSGEFTCQESDKRSLQELYAQAKELYEDYGAWFERLSLFHRTKEEFEIHSGGLREIARDIVFLSLNASVASYKTEGQGEIFGVLAGDVRINAKENDELIEEIVGFALEFSQSIERIMFTILSIRLEMEMVTYFIKELHVAQAQSAESNIAALLRVVERSNEELDDLLMSMQSKIHKIIQTLSVLERQSLYLDSIRIYGEIESARIANGLGFNEIFSQLQRATEKLTKEVEAMQKLSRFSLNENTLLFKRIQEASKSIQRLQNIKI